ncbi:schwannomin-interacting protein 1-like isoform X2 [Protopterus annectens]|nr:schwannomin-interacting protein 1-like isoform X2 [Protopterus annectens]
MTRRIIALTSRRQSKMNLQLCFINDSSSDQESETEDTTSSQAAEETQQVSDESCQESSHPTQSKSFSEKRKELKMEAERLLAETKKQMKQNERTAKETCVALLTKSFGDEIAVDEKKQRLEHSDLQKMTMKQIEIMKDSITAAIQNLNTELMQLLLTRDELKMEQDAFLLEMEDWAKLEESQQRHSWRKEEK